MGRRIIFEFLPSPQVEPENWEAVKEFLTTWKVDNIKQPIGLSPYVISAIFPDEGDIEQFLEELKAMEGIGRAELDPWRDIL